MELQILMGHVLRQLRQGRGLTLNEVARKGHVSASSLSEAERGKNPVSSELIRAVCEVLDVPMSEMLAEVSDLLEQVEKGELEYATA